MISRSTTLTLTTMKSQRKTRQKVSVKLCVCVCAGTKDVTDEDSQMTLLFNSIVGRENGFLVGFVPASYMR